MDLKVDHNSPVPLHAQVEKLLRELIKQSPFREGAFLPREVELAKELGISRNTLRQATNKLEYEGLLMRKKGVGTKVAEQSVVTHLQQWQSFTQEMNEQGVKFKNYKLVTEWVEAGEKVGRFFELPEDVLVLKVSRLRGDDEGPFVFFESFFHPRIGLTGEENFSRPLYDILEHDCNVIPSLSKEKIKARLATSITAGRLKISQGEPVLVRERFVYDAGELPLEYNLGFYRADKFTYTIDIRR
ncbi:GntR family transcriptional regulator [Marinilabilia rubra]|uniref:GntR family transcriptional regulator n=1 Tax=Marinilabilia rubra TaxID=2162893 RepID=A0A2U2B488_9BACT|nr:GntR family transcriptional regulator [Marinilabilia rubra]PWD97854.1 GntR family transcriptional regulator [Marinilabilia rubra]